ncbi:MAG: hypothetical protein PHQ06_01420 [Atribacterota bacterium]|nr:hypothetical protein [Atribacterota bacterium]
MKDKTKDKINKNKANDNILEKRERVSDFSFFFFLEFIATVPY